MFHVKVLHYHIVTFLGDDPFNEFIVLNAKKLQRHERRVKNVTSAQTMAGPDISDEGDYSGDFDQKISLYTQSDDVNTESTSIGLYNYGNEQDSSTPVTTVQERSTEVNEYLTQSLESLRFTLSTSEFPGSSRLDLEGQDISTTEDNATEIPVVLAGSYQRDKEHVKNTKAHSHLTSLIPPTTAVVPAYGKDRVYTARPITSDVEGVKNVPTQSSIFTIAGQTAQDMGSFSGDADDIMTSPSDFNDRLYANVMATKDNLQSPTSMYQTSSGPVTEVFPTELPDHTDAVHSTINISIEATSISLSTQGFWSKSKSAISELEVSPTSLQSTRIASSRPAQVTGGSTGGPRTQPYSEVPYIPNSSTSIFSQIRSETLTTQTQSLNVIYAEFKITEGLAFSEDLTLISKPMYLETREEMVNKVSFIIIITFNI